jgi:hypothetical protein
MNTAAYRAGPGLVPCLVFNLNHDISSYGQVGLPLEVAGRIVEFTTARSKGQSARRDIYQEVTHRGSPQGLLGSTTSAETSVRETSGGIWAEGLTEWPDRARRTRDDERSLFTL